MGNLKLAQPATGGYVHKQKMTRSILLIMGTAQENVPVMMGMEIIKNRRV
tara:strand:+ start:832 stop:981 length:150 start_codon:yes stop_codon:yes gene_type:complete